LSGGSRRVGRRTHVVAVVLLVHLLAQTRAPRVEHHGHALLLRQKTVDVEVLRHDARPLASVLSSRASRAGDGIRLAGGHRVQRALWKRPRRWFLRLDLVSLARARVESSSVRFAMRRTNDPRPLSRRAAGCALPSPGVVVLKMVTDTAVGFKRQQRFEIMNGYGPHHRAVPRALALVDPRPTLLYTHERDVPSYLFVPPHVTRRLSRRLIVIRRVSLHPAHVHHSHPSRVRRLHPQLSVLVRGAPRRIDTQSFRREKV